MVIHACDRYGSSIKGWPDVLLVEVRHLLDDGGQVVLDVLQRLVQLVRLCFGVVLYFRDSWIEFIGFYKSNMGVSLYVCN